MDYALVLGNLSGIAEQQRLEIGRLHAELARLTPAPRPGTESLMLFVLAGVALGMVLGSTSRISPWPLSLPSWMPWLSWGERK